MPHSYYDPANYTPLDDHGTSHMVAIDQSGMAVSFRATVSPQLFDGVVAEAKF
jgi:gamma-glutamyltranspeptidase